MEASVVIPTCNRRENLLALLEDLEHSLYPIKEVIIVDSSDKKMTGSELSQFKAFPIEYIESEKSVCLQRNKGIASATSPWVFVCDDDIEVPPEYLTEIVTHISQHPEAVAVSGLVLQLEGDSWIAKYPVRSAGRLLWTYVFQLSIWGEIECRDNFLTARLKRYYRRKGNHISRAGWPVITDFNGHYFATPIYGLGASVIKKEWLIKFPYPEMLDRHGIGDNYGLAINFPTGSIHVLNTAKVYHHQESKDRLDRSRQYFRRIMALEFFMKTNKNLKHTRKRFLVWSLAGHLFSFVLRGDVRMAKAAFKSIYFVISNKNPYCRRTRSEANILQPRIEN